MQQPKRLFLGSVGAIACALLMSGCASLNPAPTLADTLAGKIAAWRDSQRRQSKRIKDLGDIARLVEAHPDLWQQLPTDLSQQLDKPT